MNCFKSCMKKYTTDYRTIGSQPDTKKPHDTYHSPVVSAPPSTPVFFNPTTIFSKPTPSAPLAIPSSAQPSAPPSAPPLAQSAPPSTRLAPSTTPSLYVLPPCDRSDPIVAVPVKPVPAKPVPAKPVEKSTSPPIFPLPENTLGYQQSSSPFTKPSGAVVGVASGAVGYKKDRSASVHEAKLGPDRTYSRSGAW